RTGTRGYGLLHQALERGAVASTWAHDSHNLLVVGRSASDMAAAARWVVERGGGMAAALDGQILAAVHLPVGGIVSPLPVEQVAEQVRAFRAALGQLGFTHPSPFMALGALTLAVSPELKVTDKGLVDVQEGRIVDLFVARSCDSVAATKLEEVALVSTAGVQRHLRIGPGIMPRNCLIPGDLARAERIAAFFDNRREVIRNREFVGFIGEVDGVPVGVCSTGIGGPSASIAVEELANIGVDTFIRVGSAGGRQPHIPIGSVAIIHAAHREDGTSRAYLPPEFPAVADLAVTNALVDAARQLNQKVF